MKVCDLTPTDLRRQLQNPGIYLEIGPFIVLVQSPLSGVAQGIQLLYADYPIAGSGFADFHVRLARPMNLRRWFRPQVLFFFDGSIPFKPLPLGQAFAMFEWCLNWCISSHAHQYLIVHAAAVARDGRAIILPGPPGSGKSTLCAGLVNRGWHLLSDELTLVSLEDHLIAPLPRPIGLKNESIALIRDFSQKAIIGRESFDGEKGRVAHMRAPADSVSCAHEAASPAWVIFPKYNAGAAAELKPFSKAQAFMRLAANAFNYSLLGVKGFEALSSLIDSSDCHEFSYGRLEEAVALFDSFERPSV